MVLIYRVNDDGTLSELLPHQLEFSSSDVFIVVDEDGRTIYVWKGSNSSVRRKFISAQSARNLKVKYGPSYKIVVMDEGSETDDFKEALKKVGAPAIIPGKAVEREVARPSTTVTSQPVEKTPTTRTDELKMILEELMGATLPSHYKHDIVILRDQAFLVGEEKSEMKGRIITELRVKGTASFSDGVHTIEDRVPRLLVKNGRILAIELLKRA